MQKLLARLVLALVGTLALAACTGSGSSGQTLDAAEFAELADSPGVVVLDVRTPEEFAAGHLPGATNIDVSATDFASRVAELDAETSYALYCRTGNRSATAMQIMQDAGFGSVAHLGGGITAWTDSGGAVTTES